MGSLPLISALILVKLHTLIHTLTHTQKHFALKLSGNLHGCSTAATWWQDETKANKTQIYFPRVKTLKYLYINTFA